MLIRSLVALSLSAVLLAGCGGDDEPTGAAPSTPPAATTVPVTPPTTPVVEEAPEEAEQPKEEKTDDQKAGDTPSWVNKVNYRCKKHQEANNKVLNDFQKKGNMGPESAAEAMDAVVPLGRELVVDLRKIDVPADVDQRWDSFLDTLDDAFDLMPQLAKTLTSGKEDPELMKKLQDVEKNTKPFSTEFGLKECLTAGA